MKRLASEERKAMRGFGWAGRASLVLATATLVVVAFGRGVNAQTVIGTISDTSNLISFSTVLPDPPLAVGDLVSVASYASASPSDGGGGLFVLTTTPTAALLTSPSTSCSETGSGTFTVTCTATAALPAPFAAGAHVMVTGTSGGTPTYNTLQAVTIASVSGSQFTYQRSHTGPVGGNELKIGVRVTSTVNKRMS